MVGYKSLHIFPYTYLTGSISEVLLSIDSSSLFIETLIKPPRDRGGGIRSSPLPLEDNPKFLRLFTKI